MIEVKKYLQKIRTKQLNKRGIYVIVVTISILGIKLVNTIGNKIFSYIVPQDQLSYYVLLLKTATFLSNIALMNLGYSLLRFGAEYNSKNEPKKLRNLITTITVIPSILFVSLIIFSFFSSDVGFKLIQNVENREILPIVAAMGLYLIFGTITSTYSKLKRNSLIYVIDNFLPVFLSTLISLILLFVTDLGVNALIFGYLFAFGISRLVTYLMMAKQQGMGILSFKEAKKSLKLSGPLVINSYLTTIIDFVFPVMIYIQNEANLIIYSYAVSVANLSLMLNQIVRVSYVPEVYRMYDEGKKERLKRTIRRMTRLYVVAVIPIVFFIFAFKELALLIFYNELYLAGATVLFLMAIRNLINLFGLFYTHGLTLKKRTRLISILSFSGVVAKFLAGIILIPILGINGLAFAMLFQIIVSQGLIYIFSQREFYIPINYKKIALLACFVLIWMGFSYVLVTAGIDPILAVFVIPSIFYLVLVYSLHLITIDDMKFVFKLIVK